MVVTRPHAANYKQRQDIMNIRGFMQALATRTPSKETRRAYFQDLKKYQAFLKSKGLRVTQATPSTINEFIAHLVARHGAPLAPATIARRLAVISGYYEFLGEGSDGAITNPVKRVKRPTVDNDLPRAVADDVLERLIEGMTDKRDRAIVLLFIYSGLRLSELRQLDLTTITSRKHKAADGTVEYFGVGEVMGKGRKRRQFLVGPAALQALADYVNECRRSAKDGPLFLSERKDRISGRAIQQMVNNWCLKLRLPHVHVHQLRHSFATRNVNAGMSAVVLQELMAHSNLASTQRYFRVRPERLTREYFSVMEYIRQGSPV
jgi:site-specific recombinase XerD